MQTSDLVEICSFYLAGCKIEQPYDNLTFALDFQITVFVLLKSTQFMQAIRLLYFSYGLGRYIR